MFTDIIISLPAILMVITIHEYAHGWVADKLGDPTARLAGRLTLNPLVHIDPIGFIMLLIARFGWAKPVPVNPANLRNPRSDMVWISLAGPVSNILFAFLLSFLLRVFVVLSGSLSVSSLLFVVQLLRIGMIISIALAVFNLIPIPPLDGSKILAGLLPPRQAYEYERITPYGGIILLSLILFGRFTGVSIIGGLIWPVVNLFLGFLT